mmetsp:Transcript_77541/g.116555  ORF Transcript_77541/g.116555 Transcript_77541/m.116555 type:complete len:87 (+) Transcript_77541:2648-2908(+)
MKITLESVPPISIEIAFDSGRLSRCFLIFFESSWEIVARFQGIFLIILFFFFYFLKFIHIGLILKIHFFRGSVIPLLYNFYCIQCI